MSMRKTARIGDITRNDSMPPELDPNQPPSQPEAQPPVIVKEETVIKDPEAVLATIKALREEIKGLRKSDAPATTMPPEIMAELDRLRKFQADKDTEEKARKDKELEDRKQYDALLFQARQDGEKQINALNEQLKHNQAEIAKRDSLLSDRELTLREYRLRTSAREAFFAQGGKRGDESQGGDFYFDLVWDKAIKSNLIEQEDKSVQVVNGENIFLDEEKKPLDLNGLVKLRKSAYGFAFDPDPESSGSGKAPTTPGRGQPARNGQLEIPESYLSNRSEMIRWGRTNNVPTEKILPGIGTGEIQVKRG